MVSPHTQASLTTLTTAYFLECSGGTAILSKFPALSATYNLPGHPDESDVAGRIVTLEFEPFYLVGTYVPNAGQNLKVRYSLIPLRVGTSQRPFSLMVVDVGP